MPIHKYLQDNLNQEQYTAAIHTKTSSLILAGAGAGKTRTLTYKIMYLITHFSIKPKRILAVTFTNKAANEMKERLMELSHEFAKLNLPKKKAETKTASSTQPKKVASTQSTEEEDMANFLAAIAEDGPSQHGSTGMLSPKDLMRVGTFHGIFLKILKQDIELLDPIYPPEETKKTEEEISTDPE
jgi:superfamily I DNA/RNA helicase